MLGYLSLGPGGCIIGVHVLWRRLLLGSRDSWLVRAPDSWSKGCECESRQEQRENFLLRSYFCVLTLIRCPFHPVLPQWIHPWPNEVGVGWLCRCQGTVWEVTRKRAHTRLVRNIRPQSSQPAEPLWTDPWIKSEISVRELTSTSQKKKKKKRRRGMNGWTFSPNPSQPRIQPLPPPPTLGYFADHHHNSVQTKLIDE